MDRGDRPVKLGRDARLIRRTTTDSGGRANRRPERTLLAQHAQEADHLAGSRRPYRRGSPSGLTAYRTGAFNHRRAIQPSRDARLNGATSQSNPIAEFVSAATADSRPRPSSAKLQHGVASGGVRGQVVGATNDERTLFDRRPLTVPDLFRTLCQAFRTMHAPPFTRYAMHRKMQSR